jgi:hypothetical protein
MTTTQTSIYILGIVILILFMLGLSYIIFQLPNSDSMDDSNNILQISQLKHVRSILWVIIWGIGLAIIFMLSNLSLAYLTNKMIGNLFFGFYRIMFYVTLVGIPVYTMFILYRAFQDREFQNMLNRGAELRGQP